MCVFLVQGLDLQMHFTRCIFANGLSGSLSELYLRVYTPAQKQTGAKYWSLAALCSKAVCVSVGAGPLRAEQP